MEEKKAPTEMHTAVAEAMVKVGALSVSSAVAIMVEREVKRRGDALVTVFDKFQETAKKLRRIKPEVEAYDGEGKLVSATFTKAQITERNSMLQQIEKMTKAIDLAVGFAGDFSKVFELAGGKKDE